VLPQNTSGDIHNAVPTALVIDADVPARSLAVTGVMVSSTPCRFDTIFDVPKSATCGGGAGTSQRRSARWHSELFLCFCGPQQFVM
jgi:hypothetical protein